MDAKSTDKREKEEGRPRPRPRRVLLSKADIEGRIPFKLDALQTARMQLCGVDSYSGTFSPETKMLRLDHNGAQAFWMRISLAKIVGPLEEEIKSLKRSLKGSLKGRKRKRKVIVTIDLTEDSDGKITCLDPCSPGGEKLECGECYEMYCQETEASPMEGYCSSCVPELHNPFGH